MAVKTVLITGAHGFVGRHAARTFAQEGWHVVGMGYGKWDKPEWQEWGIARWHECAVHFQSLLAYGGTPDLIIHCAGGSSVGFSLINPLEDFQQTVETTANVLEFVRLNAPGAKFIYPSSAAVYGSVSRGKISENTPLNPVSPYGTHKIMAELLCESYTVHFNVRVSLIRFFSIYGNGLAKQLLWDLCCMFEKKDEAIILHGTGNEVRDLIHIDDASRLMVVASENASNTRLPVNGGMEIGTTVREIAEEVRNAFGSNREIKFNGIVRKGDPTFYQADISRSQSWGWKPLRDWRTGVKDYVKWFKNLRGVI